MSRIDELTDRIERLLLRHLDEHLGDRERHAPGQGLQQVASQFPVGLARRLAAGRTVILASHAAAAHAFFSLSAFALA